MLLTVISGAADTGKSLVAEALQREKGWAMVARDHVRPIFGKPIPESTLTLVTMAIAKTLLQCGESVITVGWNLEPFDRENWSQLAQELNIPCRWITCASYVR